MRTTLNIEDNLLEKAAKLTGIIGHPPRILYNFQGGLRPLSQSRNGDT